MFLQKTNTPSSFLTLHCTNAEISNSNALFWCSFVKIWTFSQQMKEDDDDYWWISCPCFQVQFSKSIARVFIFVSQYWVFINKEFRIKTRHVVLWVGKESTVIKQTLFSPSILFLLYLWHLLIFLLFTKQWYSVHFIHLEVCFMLWNICASHVTVALKSQYCNITILQNITKKWPECDSVKHKLVRCWKS